MNKQQASPPSQKDQVFIKEISEEVLEEKESIIEQLTKQLQVSLSRTNITTQQLQDLKTKITQIDVKLLQDQGFIKENTSRYLLVLDITQNVAAEQKIFIDAAAQVVKADERDSSATEKINHLQVGYLKYVQQCDLLLKTLEEQEKSYSQKLQEKEKKETELNKLLAEKEQKEEAMLTKIQKLEQDLLKNSEEKNESDKYYSELIERREEEQKETMEREATLHFLEAKVQSLNMKLQEKQAQLHQKLERQEKKSAKLMKLLQEKQQNANLLVNNIQTLQQSLQRLKQDREKKENHFLQQLSKRQAKESQLTQLIQKKEEVQAALIRKNEELEMEIEIRKKVEEKQTKEEDSRHSERKTKKQQTLIKTIEVKEALCHTLKQNLDKKQKTHQKIISQKDIKIQNLSNQLAKYQNPNQSHPSPNYQQLHEYNECLEMELEEEKRQRALEKAGWREEKEKLSKQMDTLKGEYEELLRENKKSKEQATSLPRQSDCQKVNSNGEVRITNNNLIKPSEEELAAIQSPHQCLPRTINSVEHFGINNELKSDDIVPALKKVEEEEPHNIFDKIKETDCQGQKNQSKLPHSPERDDNDVFSNLKIQTIDKNNKNTHQQHLDTNKSFPEAKTDIKEPTEVKPFQIKEEVVPHEEKEDKKEDKKEEEKEEKKEEKKLQRDHKPRGERCMRPIKPDKPGKHRKVIYLNY